jgi:hypothetical protein
MALKKKNKNTAQLIALKQKKVERKEAKGTYYKEVRNELKDAKVQNNFKLVPKAKAMRLIAGIAYTKYSKFFQQGILKLVTDYVGR